MAWKDINLKGMSPWPDEILWRRRVKFIDSNMWKCSLQARSISDALEWALINQVHSIKAHWVCLCTKDLCCPSRNTFTDLLTGSMSNGNWPDAETNFTGFLHFLFLNASVQLVCISVRILWKHGIICSILIGTNIYCLEISQKQTLKRYKWLNERWRVNRVWGPTRISGWIQ